MAGWSVITNDDDDNSADGNARGNADDVGASNQRGSTPTLDTDVLVVVVIDANSNADKVPPFISRPDPAGPFGRPDTHNVPNPPGLQFNDFISPCTCKRSIKIRRNRRRHRRRGNKQARD